MEEDGEIEWPVWNLCFNENFSPDTKEERNHRVARTRKQ